MSGGKKDVREKYEKKCYAHLAGYPNFEDSYFGHLTTSQLIESNITGQYIYTYCHYDINMVQQGSFKNDTSAFDSQTFCAYSNLYDFRLTNPTGSDCVEWFGGRQIELYLTSQTFVEWDYNITEPSFIGLQPVPGSGRFAGLDMFKIPENTMLELNLDADGKTLSANGSYHCSTDSYTNCHWSLSMSPEPGLGYPLEPWGRYVMLASCGGLLGLASIVASTFMAQLIRFSCSCAQACRAYDYKTAIDIFSVCRRSSNHANQQGNDQELSDPVSATSPYEFYGGS